MSAHHVKDWRFPVPTYARAVHHDQYVPRGIEYLVVEEWSDGTMRHPTSGWVTTAELFWEDPSASLHIMRTEH